MEVEEVKSRDTGDALAGSGMGTGQEGQEGNADEVDWCPPSATKLGLSLFGPSM